MPEYGHVITAIQKSMPAAVPVVTWLTVLGVLVLALVVAGVVDASWPIPDGPLLIPAVALVLPFAWTAAGEVQAALLARLRARSVFAVSCLEQLQQRDPGVRFSGFDEGASEHGVMVLAPPLSRPVVLIPNAMLATGDPDDIVRSLVPLLATGRHEVLLRLAYLWFFAILLVGIPEAAGVAEGMRGPLSVVLGFAGWPLIKQLVRPATPSSGETLSPRRRPWAFGPEFWRVV